MSWARRWGGYIVLVIVFAIACGLLSWWQWARRAETVAQIDLIETNYDAAPVPLDDLLPSLDADPADAEWHPVELTGTYLTAEQVLVRNRPRNSSAGFEVLVPLQLADGSLFVVDRGWVPGGATPDRPDSVPAAPAGTVTVEVRLKPSEVQIAGRTATAGTVGTVHLPEIAALVGAPTYTGMYGLLMSENPPVAESPLASIRPAEDEGPHLSYALQWIAFGILAFIGLVWAIRRERLIGEPRRARRPRRERDADVEDAILDSAA